MTGRAITTSRASSIIAAGLQQLATAKSALATSSPAGTLARFYATVHAATASTVTAIGHVISVFRQAPDTVVATVFRALTRTALVGNALGAGSATRSMLLGAQQGAATAAGALTLFTSKTLAALAAQIASRNYLVSIARGGDASAAAAIVRGVARATANSTSLVASSVRSTLPASQLSNVSAAASLSNFISKPIAASIARVATVGRAISTAKNAVVSPIGARASSLLRQTALTTDPLVSFAKLPQMVRASAISQAATLVNAITPLPRAAIAAVVKTQSLLSNTAKQIPIAIVTAQGFSPITTARAAAAAVATMTGAPNKLADATSSAVATSVNSVGKRVLDAVAAFGSSVASIVLSTKSAAIAELANVLEVTHLTRTSAPSSVANSREVQVIPAYTTTHPVASAATQRGHLSQAIAAVVALINTIRKPMPRPVDGRLVVYRPDLSDSAAALRWNIAAPGDVDWFWLDLSEAYSQSTTTISSPSATVAAIGAETPPAIDMLVIEAWPFDAKLLPGLRYTSAGPRIKMRVTIATGATGLDYTVNVSWQDSDGETKSVPVNLYVGAV
jgi:hypothetical protein